jgi:hypothetical protein
MLTAEVKINHELIAVVQAQNVQTLSDRPGDFIGQRATVCEYEYNVIRYRPANYADECWEGTVTHDRRFGWQGLLHKILGETLPTVLDTITAEDDAEKS